MIQCGTVRVEMFRGAAMAPHLPALARLRIAVFRDWPYLYDGDPAYEQRYLADFAASPDAGLAVAFDGDMPVGCSTCEPLADAGVELRAPFRAHGIDPIRVFYFGESVLLPAYRGQGVGVAFFAEREAHARRVSACDYAAFCSVIRPQDHPLRPPEAVPLDAFWRKRGYAPCPGLECTMRWKQVDSVDEVENRLQFWMKPLSGAAVP
ncbi:GNAT family N-acetyltransferase [Limobrevibacterium gyesilva]|uniref:GNAT family N-acetyltransferase n=1 Tax=Limobrevibacterium gyesilva TaxID=2991712 RepID=A0AA41YNX7_9PROT|nr:GNAT family N-acetyltransferase [Limobrevibacterium gyesilva]MCW3476205.1 GNAT family N-acetyltransferase [Limobrevibacterium gyesilva]